MRLAVFSARADLERTGWWPLLVWMPGLEALLLCEVTGSRDAGAPVAVLRRWQRSPGAASLVEQSGPGSPAGSARPVPCAEACREVAAWTPAATIIIGSPLDPAMLDLPPRTIYRLQLGTPSLTGEASPGFWELFTNATTIEARVVRAGDQRTLITLQALVYRHDTLDTLRRRVEELGGLALIRALAGVPGERSGAAGPGPRPAPTAGQRMVLRVRRAVRRGSEWLHPRAWLKTTASLTFLGLIRPLRDFWRTARGRHPVRVFTFHRVSDLCRDGMTVSPALFDRQLASITRHHDVVSLEDALASLRRGDHRRRPLAAITFDDAYRSVLQFGYPLLRRRGLPATIFTCSDLVGTAGRYQHDAACPVRDLLDVMDWQEHRHVLDNGWGIGGHTATHARLSECDAARLRYELETPIAALEQRLGVRAPTMSWPFGSRADITAEALRVIAGSGYSACFSSYFGENVDAEASFEIRRIDLGGDHPALAWQCWMHGFELKSGRRWLSRLGLGTTASGS